MQVYALTTRRRRSACSGVAEFVPIVALALIGGALADAFDRRKLIWGAELAAMLVSAALLVNALAAAPAAVACSTWRRRCSPRASAVLRPPLDALMPRLVERDELKAASAISWSLGAAWPRSPGRRSRAC